MDAMIRVEHLTKKFGEVTAVNDVSFEVQRGEVFAFLGPNGAGKTTTIKMLTTLLKPTSGTLEHGRGRPRGRPHRRYRPRAHRRHRLVARVEGAHRHRVARRRIPRA